MNTENGSISTGRKRAQCTVKTPVTLSVSPSVRNVPVIDENDLTCCYSFFSPYGSPISLVLSVSNIFTKFRAGAINTAGV